MAGKSDVTRKAIVSDVDDTDVKINDEFYGDIIQSVNAKMAKAGAATFKTAADENAGTKAPYYIRTGIPALDYAVGGTDNPGIPGARVIEIYGAESHGKTSLALHILSKVMNVYNGMGLIQDAEQVLTVDRIESFGIDINKVWVSQPETIEDAFEAQDSIISDLKARNEARKKTGKPFIKKPICVVLDSVAACPTKAEFEGSYDQSHMATLARAMSMGLKKIKGAIAQNSVMAMYLNQVRDTMASYGAKSDTPGGRALKFYAAVRMEVSRVEWLKKDKNADPYGMKVQVRVTKNKVAPPLKKAVFELYFDRDYVFNEYGAVIDWLKSHDIIGGGQGYYGIEGKKRRYQEAVDIFAADEELWLKYRDMAYSLSGNDVVSESFEDDGDGDYDSDDYDDDSDDE